MRDKNRAVQCEFTEVGDVARCYRRTSVAELAALKTAKDAELAATKKALAEAKEELQ